MFDLCEYCGGDVKPVKFLHHDNEENLDEFEGVCCECSALTVECIDHDIATQVLEYLI